MRKLLCSLALACLSSAVHGQQTVNLAGVTVQTVIPPSKIDLVSDGSAVAQGKTTIEVINEFDEPVTVLGHVAQAPKDSAVSLFLPPSNKERLGETVKDKVLSRRPVRIGDCPARTTCVWDWGIMISGDDLPKSFTAIIEWSLKKPKK